MLPVRSTKKSMPTSSDDEAEGHDGPPDRIDGWPFYRICPADGGLVDVWLTTAEPVIVQNQKLRRMDFRFQVMAVTGIDPNDPQWGGDLEGHIREHYRDWLESAEVIEI